jgi:hypothetical protein
MANLLKESKRGGYLPRLSGARIHTGVKYAEWGDEKHEHGAMPPLLSTLNVAAPTVGGDEYQLQFTEDEVLRIIAEWTSEISVRRSRIAYDARQAAEKVARHAAR